MKRTTLPSLALVALACSEVGDQPLDPVTVPTKLSITGDCSDGACCPPDMRRVFLTPKSDHFAGHDANRCIVAEEGSDSIVVQTSGPTAVFGGPGGDRIVTGLGPDAIRGGSGDDVITSGPALDTVFGNAGDDFIDSGDGNDTVVPGPGIDTVRADGGDDTVAIYHLCELPQQHRFHHHHSVEREVLDGGSGRDTLITPVPQHELERRGVIVRGFEEIRVEQNGCKSECACPANKTCVEKETPGSVECLDSGVAGCAQVTLLPSPTRPLHVHRVGPGQAVDVAVDLQLSQGAERTLVTIEPCEASALRGFQRTFYGGVPFLVFGTQGAPWAKAGWTPLFADTAWDWVAAACVNVTATTFDLRGEMVSAGTARIRRGDTTISGRLLLPDGVSNVSLYKVVVEADVLGANDEFVHLPVSTTDDQGSYLISGAPSGTLIRLRATKHESPELFLSGDISPLLELGSTATTVDLPLNISAPPGDAFEPDDTLTQLTGKPSATLGTPQTHNLNGASDIDITPFEVSAGTGYRISVTPMGARPGDLIVQIVDSSEQILASANETLEDFHPNPVLSWTASLSGRVFAKVTRRDDEDADAPYTIVVEAL